MRTAYQRWLGRTPGDWLWECEIGSVGVPSFRGIICQSGLAAVRAEGDAGARAIAATDPRSIEALSTVTKLGWIDAQHMHALNRAFLDAAGPAGYVEMWKRHTFDTSEIAFFQGLFASAIRIFGKTPIGLTRWIGRAWEVTTRDHGTMAVTSTHDSVQVRLKDCPAGVRVATIPMTTQATVMALFEMAGCEPDVSLDVSAFERDGQYTVVGRWAADTVPGRR